MNPTDRRPTDDPAPGVEAPPLRVLVVDDDADMRRYITLSLERAWGRRVAVFPCADGAEALRVLREERPDVLVTDVRLPGIDGLALCESAQAGPGRPGIPALVVTGDPDAVHRAAALAAQRPDRAVLVKPFNASGLVAALEKLLEGG